MEKELAVAAFGVVLQVAVAVGADAGAHQEHLAAPELHERVAKIQAALADRLDLGAHEAQARLGPLEDLVVEEGLAIRGDDPLALVLLSHSRMVAPFSRGA